MHIFKIKEIKYKKQNNKMKSLTQYLTEAHTKGYEAPKNYGVYEGNFSIKMEGSNMDAECDIYVGSEIDGKYKLVYLKIDYWNNTLICRIGKTHQDKYAVAVFKVDNKGGVDLGKSRAAIPWVNGYKYDAVRMGGKIQYSFDDKEYKEVMDAFKKKDDDLIEKVKNTLKTLEEYN